MNDYKDIERWSSKIQLILIALMFIGLLFSRALLSIAMIGSIILPFFFHHIKIQLWKQLKYNTVYIGLAIYYFLHLISVFWSENMNLWTSELQLKLPVLLFPISILSLPLKNKDFRIGTLRGMQGVLILGMFYSLYYLGQNWEQFLKGKHFKGPMENDYLRFAIALVLTLNMTLYDWWIHPKTSSKSFNWGKLMNLGFVVLVILYLHLQSSKLGLLSLYSLLLIIGVGYFKNKWGAKRFYISLSAFILLVVMASLTLPVFNHQFSRIQKELKVWNAQDHQEFNDPDVTSFVPRLISYQIALQLIRAYPFTGVGAGQVFPAMQQVYKEEYPTVNLVITPHNQVLNTSVALGIGAGVLILLILIYPIIKSVNIFEAANAVVILIASMVEAMLEIQNGLFIYLFFTFWWIKKRWIADHPPVVFNKNEP